MALERFMVSKEYMGTARTLLRIAKNMTDQAMADRLKALAEDYERRGAGRLILRNRQRL